MKVSTTTQCIERAQEILREAELVQTREQHAQVWDKKVDLMRIINNSFETGYFTGEAYNELKEAKRLLNKAETVAGNNSRHYMKNN